MQAGDPIQPNEQMDELLKQAFLDLDPELPEDSRLMDQVAANVLSKEWPLAAGQHAATSTTVAAAGKGIKSWIWILSSVVALLALSYAGWEWYESTQTHPLTANETGGMTPETQLPQPETIHTVSAQTLNYVPSPVETITQRADEGALHAVNTFSATETTNGPGIAANAPVDTHTYQAGTLAYASINATHSVNGSTSTVVNLPVASSDTKSDPKASASGSASLQNVALSGHTAIDSTTTTTITRESYAPMPQLSESEKLMQSANMEQMLGEMAGLRFNDYHKVDVAPAVTGIKTGYYIKRTEVSIKEYTLFLNDLILKGRGKDYETARPKPELVWNDPKDRNNKTFLMQYLKKRTYENYPIICITPQGMELYCAWLKEEIESYYKRNKRELSMAVRLPLEREWQYAATEGKKGRRYGTQNGRLKTWREGYIVNFAEKQQKFIASDDTILPLDPKWAGKDKKATHRVNRSMFIEKPFGNAAYHGWELSDMSGNVSEVVARPGGGDSTMVQYRSIGGNWNSPKAFLRIDAPDEFGGRLLPSPYIGFRPVIVINP